MAEAARCIDGGLVMALTRDIEALRNAFFIFCEKEFVFIKIFEGPVRAPYCNCVFPSFLFGIPWDLAF